MRMKFSRRASEQTCQIYSANKIETFAEAKTIILKFDDLRWTLFIKRPNEWV
jgi:hypothetical protein